MEKMNIEEATRHWVRGFNAIPQSIIEKAYGGDNIDELNEITPITVGDTVWSNEHQGAFEVLELDIEQGQILLEIDEEKVWVDSDDCSLERDGYLPMWGTMWTFEDNIDDWWVNEDGGLQIMADCGFRIYESDELGIVFGIDGAGYNFYEHHWIPLYKARGLHWHTEEEEE